ncbi:MAG: hypothetical protein ACXAEX_07430, partial [Promethearchaeota archaeon]
MVTVKLKVLTIISEDTGITEVEYSDVETLGDVVGKFMKKYGKKLRKGLVDLEGNLENHIVIMVNGRNYQFLEGLKTE